MKNSEEIKKLVDSRQSVPEYCISRGLSAKNFDVEHRPKSQREEIFAPVLSGRRIALALGIGVCIKVAKEDLKSVLEALR